MRSTLYNYETLEAEEPTVERDSCVKLCLVTYKRCDHGYRDAFSLPFGELELHCRLEASLITVWEDLELGNPSPSSRRSTGSG